MRKKNIAAHTSHGEVDVRVSGSKMD